MWRVLSSRNVANMIEVTDLTKRYGHTTAVNRISFRVRPGRVTGFLGPNGAGKSTTMRMMLVPDRRRAAPTDGDVLAGYGPTAGNRRGGVARRSGRRGARPAGQRARSGGGVLWIRRLLRGLAAEGRNVLISSHLMSEAVLIVDHLVLIGRGPGGHRFACPDHGIELFADGTDPVGEDGRDGALGDVIPRR